MARGTIIALIGIDGAGKSTQARLLTNALRAEGRRARAFENPGGRPVIDGLARRLGRADGGALLGRRGRVTVELVVRTAAMARAVAWARATGGVAVMDRYAICQLSTMRLRRDRWQSAARMWSRAFPDPEVLVWLRLAPAVAERRVALRGIDAESRQWLDAFDAAYAALVPAQARTVDAAGSTDAVARAIREFAEEALR